MPFNKCYLNAQKYLEEGTYFNNGGKRDRPYGRDTPPMWGLFVDEIVPFDGFTVWFYHGNPIALYDHETKKYTLGNAGWKTATTKVRLNSLPDVYISQKDWEWSGRGWDGDHSGEILERIGRSIYQRIDGWRGYNKPIFAVEECSDTGDWSDSPCRSEDAISFVKKAASTLRASGIKSYEAFGTTSNVFCMKRYLIVRGIDFGKACEILEKKGA